MCPECSFFFVVFPETLKARLCSSLVWVKFLLDRPVGAQFPKLGDPGTHPTDTEEQLNDTKSSATGAEGYRYKIIATLNRNSLTFCLLGLQILCIFLSWLL